MRLAASLGRESLELEVETALLAKDHSPPDGAGLWAIVGKLLNQPAEISAGDACAGGVEEIHRLNLERLNLERPNLERLNPEWTEPRMD